MSTPLALVNHLYSDLLSQGDGVRPEQLEAVFHEAYLSVGARGLLSRGDFLKQALGLRKAIPDLKHQVVDITADDKQVTVHTEMTGTMTVGAARLPFRVMTLGLHTVSGNRIVKSHHLENWAGALPASSNHDQGGVHLAGF